VLGHLCLLHQQPIFNRRSPVNTFNAIRFVARAVTAVLMGTVTQQSAAQDTRPARSEVKAQTKAANKTGELWRGGETPLPQQPFEPQKSRKDRKDETLSARHRGELLPPGEANFKANSTRPPRSDRKRADRKAETMQAIKDGTLAPSGEAEDPAKAARAR
jgi:hypothetical protein